MERSLKRKPVDRIAVYESFWPDTKKKWVAAGRLREEESLEDHFAFDLRGAGWPNMGADLDWKEQIVEETAETKLVRNANGALLRWWKDKAGTPEHVDFLVKDRDSWNKHVRAFLTDRSLDRRRLPIEDYKKAREKCRREDLFLAWTCVNVFECMHPVCGHEYMLMGMALDPDWVKDMCNVYADLLIRLQEILFSEGGKPDGVYYFEDMGFKEKPFMSPAMYKEIVWPAHKRTFEHAHSEGLPVMVHSCGFVEPLVPGLIEAGMDCLQAMEVKAGMDLPTLFRRFGDRIAFYGGVDVRTLIRNDRAAIDAEMDKKILPVVQGGGGYVLHSDHSEPPEIDYETMRYFVERGRGLGR